MDEELAVDQPPDYTRPTQAKLNAPFHEGDAKGNRLDFGDRSISVWTKKEELFLTNRGSEELKNRGFIYCLKCGRIEPKGWHDTTRAYLNNRLAHPKPFPDSRDQPNCTGYVQVVSLGTKFISDVSLFRFRMGNGVLLPPGSTIAKICLTTVAQAIAVVVSDMLEIDRSNIGAEYRAAQTELGSAGGEADVYLYDTTPGGAGFVRAAVSNPTDLLSRVVSLLSDCDCEPSCYKCLRSYGNRFLHQDLDRKVGLSFLKHVLGLEQYPSLEQCEEERLLRVLEVDLQDSGAIVQRLDGSLVIESKGDRQIVISHSLLPNRPATNQAQAAYANGHNNAAPIPHLLIKRALPAAIDRCLNAIGERPTADSPLPGGLHRGSKGLQLLRLSKIHNRDTCPAELTDLTIDTATDVDCFLLEIDGPQLEKLTLNIEDREVPLTPGTVMVLKKVREPAVKEKHDNRLQLVQLTDSNFKATRSPVTLARCRWTTFDGKVSITLSYASTSSRATPQKVNPDELQIIGKPIGIVRAGRFVQVGF